MNDEIDEVTLQLQQQLRDKAEARLAEGEPEKRPESFPDAVELLHELQVHHIELEMQNEELRLAQVALDASRSRYIDLYDFAPVGYLTLNDEGRVTEINLTGAKLLGVPRKPLLGSSFSKFITRQDQDLWQRFFLTLMAHTDIEKQGIDLGLTCGDGANMVARFDCLCWHNAPAQTVLRMTFVDITEAKQAEVDLRISATAFECQEGMFITDANSVVLRVNQAFSQITGYSAEETIGQTPHLFGTGYDQDDFYAVLFEDVKHTKTWRGEHWGRRKNGEKYPEWLTITVVEGDDGAVLHYVVTLTDITRQKDATEQIERLAFFDPLTSLPNRHLLKDRLHLALANSVHSKLHGALLFIDLDHFKVLNDTRGHDIGDMLLQQVALRLLGVLHENDTAARLGGDEFVVMLQDLGDNPKEAAVHAEAVGKKILVTLSEPYWVANHDYRCSASIGVTLFYGHLATEADLLKHVDIAMYEAKRQGRNTLCFFNRAMQAALNERAALEASLHWALEKNQFRQLYQAQVSHNGQIIGAEALIRWQHPERGLVSPLDFLVLAEEVGLALPIGRWVLETACSQLNAWGNSSRSQALLLAVNVSPGLFHQIGFVGHVRSILQTTGIQPNRLVLELTEDMVIVGIDEAIAKMRALKALGVRIALDDFGTGYSSLSYLTQLPFDQLKIDQGFIRNLGVKHADEMIVQTIIGMANNLGMEVIAEGVETEAQRAFLAQHGCQFYQGYLFGKPMTIGEFDWAVESNSQGH